MATKHSLRGTVYDLNVDNKTFKVNNLLLNGNILVFDVDFSESMTPPNMRNGIQVTIEGEINESVLKAKYILT